VWVRGGVNATSSKQAVSHSCCRRASSMTGPAQHTRTLPQAPTAPGPQDTPTHLGRG
jgi:hypothetical protein